VKATAIDAAWRAAHPLPRMGDGMDKESRGEALLMGGSLFVPGALLLTGEAALRTGAGKVKLATVERAAVGLGLAFPEAAVIGLPTDAGGEIAADAAASLQGQIGHCDALIFGPGMMERAHTGALVEALLDRAGDVPPVLLDAGALTAMRGREGVALRQKQQLVMTPHHGELAALTGRDKPAIARDPASAAHEAAASFGAVVALKSAETLIANGKGELLCYSSRAPGLGTAGSGDVLAGIIGGLLARHVEPLVAAAWGVWLHGEAGRRASATTGAIGFLARDLLTHIPSLLTPD